MRVAPDDAALARLARGSRLRARIGGCGGVVLFALLALAIAVTMALIWLLKTWGFN